MAGQLKVDSINADSNLTLRIANTAVAFIDSNGLRPSSGNVSLDATGTTGIGAPSANTLVFYEGGVEAMRIDSSGNVGIGTTPSSWDAKLAVFNGNIALTTTTNKLYLYNASATNFAHISTAVDGSITFTNGTSSPTERMRINSVGGVQFNGSISVGGATPTTSGAGITFPATQSASSDANTLDDYEEGTWTPVATSGGGSITAYSSNGAYTKIGRTVTIFGSITTTTVGTASGTLNFSGLPFATLNSEQYVGLSREAINTGANHFAVISTSSGYLQSSTGGAITWTNGNSYRFTVTYQAT